MQEDKNHLAMKGLFFGVMLSGAFWMALTAAALLIIYL